MKFLPGFGHALGTAIQWRLLLLWSVITLLLAEILAVPIGIGLSGHLDNSTHVVEWTRRLDMVMVFDLNEAMQGAKPAISGAGAVAVILLFLLTPFLNGAFVVVSRSQTRVKLGELIRESLRQYGPMFRMTFMAVISLAIAGVVAWAAMKGVKHYAEHAILESSVTHLKSAAYILSAVAFAWANAWIDAGRASLALNPDKRSAIKAWWRGLKLVFMHPLRSIVLYLFITAIAAVALAVATWLRTEVAATSGWSFVLALLLTQVLVAVTAWMHYARLFAMLELTKALRPTPATGA